MLKFVDTNVEISAWRKDNIPSTMTGIEWAFNKTPLDFQYVSTDSITIWRYGNIEFYSYT